MFENPRSGRQARSFTTNVPKILDLKLSSEQIFSENCRWVPLLSLITSTVTQKNVIYMIQCKHFSKEYLLGETKRDRFNEHRRPVDNPSNISKPTTVSEHFLTNGHSVNDITLIPLKLIKSNRDSVRYKAREPYLTERGRTLEPLGINKKDDM